MSGSGAASGSVWLIGFSYPTRRSGKRMVSNALLSTGVDHPGLDHPGFRGVELVYITSWSRRGSTTRGSTTRGSHPWLDRPGRARPPAELVCETRAMVTA